MTQGVSVALARQAVAMICGSLHGTTCGANQQLPPAIIIRNPERN